METITIILVLLLAVVASGVIARVRSLALPLPLVQIALGALIGQAFDLPISLPPDAFFLLFVAPLLFLDGWRIPKEGLVHDKWTILALAFGLVLFTVLGAGFFIHWMIPAIPLPIAFAVAAVLSPTDAVAVSAIAGRSPVPKRLMHVLEGEALLNDASGLVCMRFAIAAAVTGSFSLGAASVTFLWLAIGGVAIGVVVTVLANAAKDWIATHFGEEIGSQILISLLIPFGTYMLADRVGASGILAAVAAGVAMAYEERAGRASAVTRVRRAAVWDAVQFAGNGVIFVLLGQQLPGIVAGAALAIRQSGRDNQLWLLAYVVAIGGVLIVLRSVWAWATLRLAVFRATRRHQPTDAGGWREIGVTALAGVRGAVTLSGVMTFPLALQDGSAFPTRDLVIFLVAGVIVMTLLVACLGLPYAVKGLQPLPDTAERQQQDQARLAVAKAAITAMEHAVHQAEHDRPDADLFAEAGARIIASYQQQIEARLNAGKDNRLLLKVDEIERALRLVALRAEREELYRIGRSGRLTDELTRLLIREVDLQETRFNTR